MPASLLSRSVVPPGTATITFALTLAFCVPVGAQVVLESVVEVGDLVPGFPDGPLIVEDVGTHPDAEIFGENAATRPVIDGLGTVALHASVGDDGVLDPQDESITAQLRARGATLEVIAHRGGPAPGTSGVFDQFPGLVPETASLDFGAATFLATFQDDVLGSGRGAWSERFGPLDQFVRNGDSLPGMGPGAVLDTSSVGTSRGTVFLFGRIRNSSTGDPNPLGLWRAVDDGRLEEIVVSGLPAPGFGTGVVFGELSNVRNGPLGSFAFDGEGRAAVTGFVKGPRIDVRSDEGIWIEGPTGLELVLKEGDRVPRESPFPRRATFESGSVSEGAFSFGGAPGIRVNDAGGLLFFAQVDPRNGDARVPTLWTRRGGELQLLLAGQQRFVQGSEPGSLAPGTDGTFVDFSFTDLNDRGHLLIRAFATVSPDPFSGTVLGLWADRGNGLEAVAIPGDEVPRIPGGVLSRLRSTELEDDGSIVFTATIATPTGPRLGAFVAPASEGVRLLLATGEETRVGDADERTVERLQLGRGTSNDGRRAFEITFADGSSGVYTAQVLPPLPPDTEAPAPPLGLRASGGDAEVRLDWEDSVEPDVAEYRVFRTSVGGAPFAFVGTALTSDFLDSELENGVAQVYSVVALDEAGNESPPSGEATATPAGGGGAATLHVSSIEVVAAGTGFRGFKRGQATVTVVDAAGARVEGAFVSGTFSGTFNETHSSVTDATGVAVLTTRAQGKSKLSIAFCVDDVAHASLQYEPGENVETCDSA